MRRLRAVLPALLAAAVAGCASSAPDQGVVRRDSAGAAVMENRAPRWANGREWRLDTARAVPLDVSEDGGAVFAVLPGGTFAVADDHGRIAWHDRRGREKRSIVLPDSPAVGALLVRPGGGLIAWDADRLAAVEVDADGSARAAQAYEAVLPRGSVVPLGALANGAVLVSVRDRTEFRINPLPTRDTVPLLRLGPAGEHARILTVPGPEEVTVLVPGGGAIRDAAPFARNAFVVVSAGSVWVADALSGEMRAYDASGRLRTLVRAPVRGDSAAPEEVARLRERLRRLARSSVPDQQRRVDSAVAVPSSWPPFAALLAGAGGELWARAGTPPGRDARWNVFDATGRWQGEVRVPASLELVAAGDGYVIARKDDRLTLIPLET
ncbi:MAG: hypothetical protein ACJ8J0_11340 [Longimicrobiaceae bacterium]